MGHKVGLDMKVKEVANFSCFNEDRDLHSPLPFCVLNAKKPSLLVKEGYQKNDQA
jgi:hypothetical protein